MIHRGIFFGVQGLVDKVSEALKFPPASRVEIGIISDTHGLVRPEVYEAFEGVGPYSARGRHRQSRCDSGTRPHRTGPGRCRQCRHGPSHTDLKKK